MNVLYLSLAIVLEVSGKISMKLSEGLTCLYPTIAMVRYSPAVSPSSR